MIWPTETVNVLDLKLDALNPRINISKKAKQEEIRRILIDNEDVINLAQRIVNWGGLYPGESIITSNENGKYVVLEGNRRVCACQLLTNPQLIPKDVFSKFPRLHDTTAVSKVVIAVSPNRESAEPFLTMRHTQSGVKRWQVIANINRFKRFYEDNGQDLDTIQRIMNLSDSTLKNLAQSYHIMKYTSSLQSWSPQERQVLETDVKQLNPYLRLFNTSIGKEIFKLNPFSRDNDYVLSSQLPPKELESYTEQAARAYIFDKTANTRTPDSKIKDIILGVFPDNTSNPDELNDITTENQVSQSISNRSDINNSSANKHTAVNPPQDTSNCTEKPDNDQSNNRNDINPKPAKQSKLFENLICTVQDDNLIGLSRELVKISKDYRSYPIATAMLIRALLESSLNYQIRFKGLTSDFITFLATKNKKVNDPGLSDLILFSVQKGNILFPGTPLGRVLNTFNSTKNKDYLDLIVHGKWVTANSDKLEGIAKDLIKLIDFIVKPL